MEHNFEPKNISTKTQYEQIIEDILGRSVWNLTFAWLEPRPQMNDDLLVGKEMHMTKRSTS